MHRQRSSRIRLISAVGAAVLASLGIAPAPGGASPGDAAYWLLAGDGGVFSFGPAPFFGAATVPPTLCAPNLDDRTFADGTCWSMAATPSGEGYWILNGDSGEIYAFGDASLFGEPADGYVGVPREFVPVHTSIVATPDGNGYWVYAETLSGAATVQTFGNATHFGDTNTILQASDPQFGGSPVALAATPTGDGYYEAYSDGGVFAFGAAPFHGSLGGTQLNQPIVGIAVAPDGNGYWLVAADGGVFAFGSAAYAGSLGSIALRRPIVGIAANGAGSGYWLVAADGGVFAFGGAPFLGSTGGMSLARPVFTIVARPV
jgi:hypothetical protein